MIEASTFQMILFAKSNPHHTDCWILVEWLNYLQLLYDTVASIHITFNKLFKTHFWFWNITQTVNSKSFEMHCIANWNGILKCDFIQFCSSIEIVNYLYGINSKYTTLHFTYTTLHIHAPTFTPSAIYT